jgi:hypothetical protein
MPSKKEDNTKAAKGITDKQSLQALQSGIDSLSLDEALAAVKLAKLKIDGLRENQDRALSLVQSAAEEVKVAEKRLGLPAFRYSGVLNEISKNNCML